MFELRWNIHTHTHTAHIHTQTVPNLSSNIKTPVWNVWGEIGHTHTRPHSTVPHAVPTTKPQHTQTLPTITLFSQCLCLLLLPSHCSLAVPPLLSAIIHRRSSYIIFYTPTIAIFRLSILRRDLVDYMLKNFHKRLESSPTSRVSTLMWNTQQAATWHKVGGGVEYLWPGCIRMCVWKKQCRMLLWSLGMLKKFHRRLESLGGPAQKMSIF